MISHGDMYEYSDKEENESFCTKNALFKGKYL